MNPGIHASETTVPKSRVLRDALADSGLTRVIGGNDSLSAMLAGRHGFDALWASGLAISTAHGVPDASILTMTEFLEAARLMNRASHLPVIADCDTGFGDINVVMRTVREYEESGIAGICIEDKQFPKRNSFTTGNELLDPAEFARKIHAAKQAQSGVDFVVVARIESLIVGTGIADALDRARRYEDAGADALLIHSKAATADEVIGFADAWRSVDGELPLVAVPTTYFGSTGTQLNEVGFSAVIYANHGLRACITAIDSTFAAITSSDGTAPVEELIAPVSQVLSMTETDKVPDQLRGGEHTNGEHARR